MRFVQTGDLHLGLKFNNQFTKEISNRRREELWETFERLVEKIREEKTPLLFLTGDLFEDEFFTLYDMRRLVELFKSIEETKVFISCGNHDYLHENSLYNLVELPDNVHVFSNKGIERVDLEDYDLSVFGYSFSNIFNHGLEIGKEDFQTDMGKSVLVIHGDIYTKSDYNPLDKDLLLSLGLDYIAMGHIHKGDIFDSRLGYAGSLEPLSFKETGEKGYIEGDLNGRVDFVPFSKREFKNLEIFLTEDDTHNSIREKFLEISERETDFFRIVLKGTLPIAFDFESLYNSLKDDFYYLELENEAKKAYDLDFLRKEFKDTVIESFIDSFTEEDDKDALYYGLDALLKEFYDY